MLVTGNYEVPKPIENKIVVYSMIKTHGASCLVFASLVQWIKISMACDCITHTLYFFFFDTITRHTYLSGVYILKLLEIFKVLSNTLHSKFLLFQQMDSHNNEKEVTSMSTSFSLIFR